MSPFTSPQGAFDGRRSWALGAKPAPARDPSAHALTPWPRLVPAEERVLAAGPLRPGCPPRWRSHLAQRPSQSQQGCRRPALGQRPVSIPRSSPEQVQAVVIALGYICFLLAARRFRGPLQAPLLRDGQRVLQTVAVPVTAAEGTRDSH